MVLLGDVPERARYLGKTLIWLGRASSGIDLPKTFSHVGSGSPKAGSCSWRHIVSRGRLVTFSLIRCDFASDLDDNRLGEGIAISWYCFSRWFRTHIRKKPATKVCSMAPSRNLRYEVSIKRKCQTIIALTISYEVIRSFREVCVACRKVASIFDKSCLSRDHAASMSTKGVGAMGLQVALFGNPVRFEDIRVLFQFLPLIVGSVLGQVLRFATAMARWARFAR